MPRLNVKVVGIPLSTDVEITVTTPICEKTIKPSRVFIVIMFPTLLTYKNT